MPTGTGAELQGRPKEGGRGFLQQLRLRGSGSVAIGPSLVGGGD